MLRKQALQLAIELLSDRQDITALLQDILDEMPGIHWTDKKIRDTVDQFVLEKGKMPVPSDFCQGGMPSKTVFQQKYNIPLSQWLEENYPRTKPSREQIIAENTKRFIEEYNRIKPTSSNEFNEKRAPGILTWNSIAHGHKLTSWYALLKLLDLPLYLAPHVPKPSSLKLVVKIHSDYDFTD